MCRECIEGFGPSIISIGYACANCTENSYGWILYILSEFVPAPSNRYHICTNELLCHVQPIVSECSKPYSTTVWCLDGAIRHNLACCVQDRALGVWILELGLLPLSHSTILCEPRPQEHPCAFPPVCVCLLSTTAHCTYIIMLVLNYMGATSDQLCSYGNHFTDAVLLFEGGGIQRHPLLMSLPHFFFCPTLSFCLCRLFC